MVRSRHQARAVNIRFVSFFALTVLLMVVFVRKPPVNERVKLWSMTVGAPLQYLVDLPSRLVGWVGASVTSKQELLKQNMELKSKNLLFQANLQQLINQQNENRTLRDLLKASNEEFSKIEVAKLLSVASNPSRKLIVLNKGARNGVFVNQAVLDGNGIVGQVIEVGPMTSVVILINDSESIIPVKFLKNGERGFLAGDGQRLSLIDIAKTAKVAKGDVLVSSGLALRLPKGYPVGVVEEVKKEAGEPFLNISVTPSAGLSNSELFLLVWPSQKQQKLHQQFVSRYQKG
jgi:rod shape-determining protein MreC